MSERQTKPRQTPARFDFTAVADRIMGRLDSVRDDLTERIDAIDTRQTERMDRIEGRIRQHQDTAFSRETEFSRQIMSMRQSLTALDELRSDVEELKRGQAGATSEIASAAAEGAAAGSASATSKVVVPKDVANAAIRSVARSPWGIAVLVAGGVSTIVGAASTIPRVWGFLGDVIPAIGYWLGGGV